MKEFFKGIMLVTVGFAIAVFSTGFSVDGAQYNSEPLTEQIWAVQVEAEPGESGSVSQGFEATSGSYDADVKDGNSEEVKEDSFGLNVDEDEDGDEDGDGETEVVKGDQYVGESFEMDQKAGTSEGTTKRHIDISSPWTGAYLHEDMKIEGEAEIKESFSMENMKPGIKVDTDWHDLDFGEDGSTGGGNPGLSKEVEVGWLDLF